MDNEPPIYGRPPHPAMPVGRVPRRSGRGWMILSILLACLLVLLFVAGFGGFVSTFLGAPGGGRHLERSLEEIVIEPNRSAHDIAVIEVEGVITSYTLEKTERTMVEFIRDQLEAATEDDSVRAVILRIDSPGGEVMASDDIARAVRKFQDETGKPVVAALGNLAASGGYYVAAPSQWIVANELTITGSIGVILHHFNYRGLLDKVGLYPQVFKSGKFKDMLSGSKRVEEIDPEEVQMIQDLIHQTYVKFKSVVANGRQRAFEANDGKGRALAEDWEQMADGRVLSGQQAFDYGFVDETGDFDTAVERAKKLANIPDANLIRYQEPFRFSSFFNMFGSTDTKTVKLDWGVELPKIRPGRLYYLPDYLIATP